MCGILAGANWCVFSGADAKEVGEGKAALPNRHDGPPATGAPRRRGAGGVEREFGERNRVGSGVGERGRATLSADVGERRTARTRLLHWRVRTRDWERGGLGFRVLSAGAVPVQPVVVALMQVEHAST